jgi:hypothetical protein
LQVVLTSLKQLATTSMLAIFTSNNAREKLMTIFNWLAETWATPLDNQEAETTTTEYGSENSYSQSYSQEQEPEQRAPGMFDWLWGSSEQELVQDYQKSEPQQSYQEPEQKSTGLFGWLFGTSGQNSEPTHCQEPEQNPYQRLAASEDLTIEGDPHFVRKIQRALTLLENHSPEDLEVIRQSATSIKSANQSGAAYWASRIDIAPDTLNTSDEYLAGVLRHEAEHNRNRISNQGLGNSVQEELDCTRKQIECLKKLNADPHEIRHLENQDGTHYQRNVTW